MCGGGGSPRPAPRLPEAPVAPSQSNEVSARDKDRRRRAASGGQGTILTSSSGVTDNAATQNKTLLGS